MHDTHKPPHRAPRAAPRATAVLAFAVGAIATTTVTAQTSITPEAAMVRGRGGFVTKPLLTVGEQVATPGGLYNVTGLPDGIGAYLLDPETVRLLVNHEFSTSSGAPFTLDNGAVFTAGSRISAFDVDIATRTVNEGHQAIRRVFVDDGAGGHTELTPANTPAYRAAYPIFRRFCSSSLFTPGEGLIDTAYFTGEETSGGREWVLDVATGALYEAPALGNGAYENIAVLNTIGAAAQGRTVIVLSDDTAGRPLYLYVGDQQPQSADFLTRNGLTGGQLHAFVADGVNSNEEFSGTGNSVAGTWVPITSNNPSVDITGDGVLDDDDDDQNQDNMVAESFSLGAFIFSRPEDVSAAAGNADGLATFVAASTGRTIPASSIGDPDGDGDTDPVIDPWGTVYLHTVNLDDIAAGDPIRGRMTIAHDGNDAGNQDFGIRSPDNLDWADDGMIYVQEDRSVGSAFGAASGIEASIWRLDPVTLERTRIGVVNRAAVPSDMFDFDPNDLGDWETSGILDVSALFGIEAGGLFVFDVQAHSIRGGRISALDLEQGGQILFMGPCAAELTGDGLLDLADLVAFISAFVDGDLTADLTGDALLDLADITVLIGLFNDGCL